MGRKSKLTVAQWEEVSRRLISGDGLSALAREFGVAPQTISEKLKSRVEVVKEVASQLVSAEVSLRSLSISEQISAISLADELRAMSAHLAGAGRLGAASAHKLAAMAHRKVLKAESGGDDIDGDTLREVAALTRMSNEASHIPMGLLAANKDRMPAPETPKASGLAKRLSSEALREIVAAKNAAD